MIFPRPVLFKGGLFLDEIADKMISMSTVWILVMNHSDLIEVQWNFTFKF